MADQNGNGNNKIHLTKEGYDDLKVELTKLQDKEPAAIDRVTKAREHGDLSENSEYHAAREDLSMIQGRIDELEDLLARSIIIKNPSKNGIVDLGCKVTVASKGSTVTYTLVGEFEADPMEKKISHDSPLGQALMGKKVGEKAEFEAPVGKVIYTIKKIH
jgi:transcription elongation factor GreA